MNIKKLLSVLFVVGMLLYPCGVFAYTTDSTVNDYGVEINESLTNATSQQTSVINAMRTRGLFVWSYDGDEPYAYNQKFSGDNPTASQIVLENGVYKGIPYQLKAYTASSTSGDRENWYNSDEEVQNAVDTMVANNSNSVKGTDCSSSVCYAWRTVVANNNSRSSGILMSTNNHNATGYHSAYTCAKIVKDGNDTSSNSDEGYANYVTRVGQYGQAASNLSNNTYNMLTRLKTSGNFTNNADVYLRVYSKMQPGDFLVSVTASHSHARLIEKVIIVREGNVIDPDNSYVVVSEQTSSLKNCTDTGLNQTYKTTWNIGYSGGTNSRYTLRNLASSTGGYYLPYRYNGTQTSNVIGFNVTEWSKDSICIQWNAIDSDLCSGYELEYADNAKFSDSNIIECGDYSVTSKQIENLDPGKSYYFRCRSYISNDGEKEYSDYNNYLSINLETGEMYRENAPETDGTAYSEKIRRDYIYEDICYDDLED